MYGTYVVPTLLHFRVGMCRWNPKPIPELVQLNFAIPYTRPNSPNPPQSKSSFKAELRKFKLADLIFLNIFLSGNSRFSD